MRKRKMDMATKVTPQGLKIGPGAPGTPGIDLKSHLKNSNFPKLFLENWIFSYFGTGSAIFNVKFQSRRQKSSRVIGLNPKFEIFP